VTVEAVIWDFGGVFTSSPFEAFNRYERARGLPSNLIRSINATNPDTNAWALFERSEIDAAAFDLQFLDESRALGHPIPGSDILPLLAGDVRPAMVQALKVCKRHFKVGTRTAEIMTLFDAVIESSKAGLRKPDPKIYLLMCELLSVKPAACVYLDDLGVNCKPAAALGMTAIKVVSQNQALADLEHAIGIDLRAEVE
jgi:putative hydrolase of the HAD superfamily